MKQFILVVLLSACAMLFAGAEPEIQITESETVFSDYALSRTEMSVKEAVNLLNFGLARNYLKIEGRGIYLANDYGSILCLASGKSIVLEDGKVIAVNGRENYPMNHITWLGAAALCNLKSLNEGLEPYYDYYFDTNPWAGGYRLPTAKEWENAAKAGSNNVYSWGPTLEDGVNVSNTAYSRTFPLYDHDAVFYGTYDAWEVDAGEANSYGMYNMCGNVSEWSADVYKTEVNDMRTHRVMKGGSFIDVKEELRIDTDMNLDEKYMQSLVGFRHARSL